MSLKRLPWLLLATCWLFSLAASLPTARAASDDSSGGKIDVNFFYDTLKDEGSWFNTTEYGDVWQPYIAYKSDSWRPYTDGYWSYTDGGWMFVSNESFGWAVYHYGRWTKLQDIGWAWVPGTEWAPAWVTWRESKPDAATGAPAADAPVSATTSDAPAADDKNPVPPAPSTAPADNAPPPPGGAPDGNYIGWAPLPPVPVGYGPAPVYGPGVDVEFGIDPYDYCFTSYGAFGSPWLAGVIFDSDRGYYCCDHSVNITNGYYDQGRGGYRGFYNGGPDYNRLRGATQRPIPQLALRQTTRSSLARQEIRSGQFNRISGHQINVAAPRFSQANVRNGRVNFTHQGTLPVTPVSKGAPAAAANNAAYKRAQESFAKQGEASRAQNPRAAGPTTPAAKGAPGGIVTTPRAQQEEHQARQEAERQGGTAAGSNNSPREAHDQAAASNREPATVPRTSSRQSRREIRQTTRESRGERGGERAVRQQRQSAGPRVERGGGGGERRGGGGGGERHGGGGERAKGAGGGGKKK